MGVGVEMVGGMGMGEERLVGREGRTMGREGRGRERVRGGGKNYGREE